MKNDLSQFGLLDVVESLHFTRSDQKKPLYCVLIVTKVLHYIMLERRKGNKYFLTELRETLLLKVSFSRQLWNKPSSCTSKLDCPLHCSVAHFLFLKENRYYLVKGSVRLSKFFAFGGSDYSNIDLGRTKSLHSVRDKVIFAKLGWTGQCVLIRTILW